MQKQISGQQAKLLTYFLEHGAFKPSARIVDYRFGQKAKEPISIAIAEVDTEERGIYGIFTLPASSDNHIFITITDGDPDEIADILSKVADYSREHNIEFGHTFQLENESAMLQAGRVAVTLLRVDAAKPLSDVPDTLNINELQYQAHLVVFLDQSEYKIKLDKGLGALLDKMESHNKDLIRFVADDRLS
jgi:hypothetical protein